MPGLDPDNPGCWCCCKFNIEPYRVNVLSQRNVGCSGYIRAIELREACSVHHHEAYWLTNHPVQKYASDVRCPGGHDTYQRDYMDKLPKKQFVRSIVEFDVTVIAPAISGVSISTSTHSISSASDAISAATSIDARTTNDLPL